MRIDFHAHILPHADHGSSSVESSVKQLEEAKKAGVDFIVATPHFYPYKHNVDSFLHRRNRGYEKIKTKLDELQIQCRLGAEVMLCEGLENLEGLEKLCIDGTPVMLLELPFREITPRLITSVCNIMEMGIVPILAHIDRYTVKNVNSVLRVGTASQLNAEAFFRIFKRGKAIKAVKHGVIQALGSDAHEDRMNCYSEFARALKKIGPEHESRIMQSAADLLNI
ncbi:MAG: histidinol-phosphatase [Clostridia bacterium]|nr:histidinol-phosphatase [Clostridia bacterium]